MTRRGDQSRDAGHQLKRLHDPVSSASDRVAQSVGDAAVIELGHAAQREGWAQTIAAEPLATFVVARCNGDGDVEVEAVEFGGEESFECYIFRRGDGELLIASWIPGRAQDGILAAKTDITIPGIRAERAWGIDTMNGSEQELDLTHRGEDTVFEGMQIKDYPIFVRIQGA